MKTSAPPSPGFVAALRTLGDEILASVQDRIGLLSLEVQEEKFRLIEAFAWISAAAFAGMMAVAFASLTLVYFFWSEARLAVLGGLTLFYTTALAAILFAFRRYRARLPKPFGATLEEIGEDRICIRTGT